jgi:hypothetical protein
MSEPPPTPALDLRYHERIAKALARVERIVIDGLRHGFFGVSIECEMDAGRKRHLVIRAGKSYKYTILEDELPR